MFYVLLQVTVQMAGWESAHSGAKNFKLQGTYRRMLTCLRCGHFARSITNCTKQHDVIRGHGWRRFKWSVGPVIDQVGPLLSSSGPFLPRVFL